jgi:hypothetical protein
MKNFKRCQQYGIKVDICQVDVNFSYFQLICWIDMREAGQSDGGYLLARNGHGKNQIK